MSKQEAFEKWYKEKYYKYDLYPKYAQFRKEIKEAWQAATAESENRIAELKQRALEESNKYVAYCDLAEAKIAELESENAEYDHINTRMRDILHATANALKGEPAALTLHSWHDLPEKALELQANTSQMVQAVSRAADAREAALENTISHLEFQCTSNDLHANRLLEQLYLIRNNVSELQAQNSELSASINVLREALETCDTEEYTEWDEEDGYIPVPIKKWRKTYDSIKVQQALAPTPAQSLQAHDDELIERCAKVVEEVSNNAYCALAVDKIRALKGKS